MYNEDIMINSLSSNYEGKTVEIREKIFSAASSTNLPLGGDAFNTTRGVVTNVYTDKFIELDHKILISLDYVYKIEVID